MTEEQIAELQARLETLQKEKDDAAEEAKAAADKAAALEAKNAELSAALKAEVTKDKLPTFEVEEDTANDIEGGEYEFTSPTFTWDDNSVIDVRELSAQAASTDAKIALKANAIISALVQRKSGIVKRKED